MTQYARVKAVLLGAEKPLSIFQIQKRIKKAFDRIDSECAISARIREIRQELHSDGQTIHSERVGSGRHYHVYWVTRFRDS